MRACRYLNVDFCQAHGIAYGPIVQAWANAAEAAEHEAEAEIMRREQKRTKRAS